MTSTHLIEVIDEEIARLSKARALLIGESINHQPQVHRQMSPEGRKRIALAMKRRWAAAKKAGKSTL